MDKKKKTIYNVILLPRGVLVKALAAQLLRGGVCGGRVWGTSVCLTENVMQSYFSIRLCKPRTPLPDMLPRFHCRSALLSVGLLSIDVLSLLLLHT